jgi:nucleotide-binding universal stress UspA family protein
MFKSILVPTDGSEVSTKATKQAVSIAQAMKAKIVGLHVYPEFHTVVLYEYMGPVPMMNRKEYVASAKATAENYLSAVENAAKAAGVGYEGVIVAADRIHEAIIKAAKRKKCDLIIMASHGRTGVSGLLLGSVTQKVINQCGLPVLVLR